MRTQRPPLHTSSQRQPPVQLAGEQKYLALFIGSRVQVSLPAHAPEH